MTTVTVALLGTLSALIAGSVVYLFVKTLLKQHAKDEESGAPEGQFQFDQRSSPSR